MLDRYDPPGRPEGPPSEEECIRRIGELICTAILRANARRHPPNLPIVPPAPPAEPSERILEYLRRHHAASPAEIRGVLNLSRSTANRVLQRLRQACRVVAQGRTTAATYRLPDIDPSRN